MSVYKFLKEIFGFCVGLVCGKARKKERKREMEGGRKSALVISDAIFARVFPLHFPHVLAFFLSFRPTGSSRLLVYSLYYAFPARWTGNAKIRRVCGARAHTHVQTKKATEG